MIRITKDGRLNQRDAAKATLIEHSEAMDFVRGRWDEHDCTSRVEAAMERIEWVEDNGVGHWAHEVY